MPIQLDRRHAAFAVRLGYVLVLGMATLTPIAFELDWVNVARRIVRALLPDLSMRAAVDAMENIALFAGWGALWAVTSTHRLARTTVVRATLSAALLSVGIEAVQLLMPGRTSSVLDVVTNTTGSAVGALVVVFAMEAARLWRSNKSYVGVPGLTFAGAYLAAGVLEAVFPDDRSIPLPGVYTTGLDRLETARQYFAFDSVAAMPLFDFVLFFPIGLLTVAALVEFGWSRRSAAIRVASVGLVCSLFAEFVHAFLATPILLGAVVVHAVAIAAGALVADRWLPSFSRRLRGRRRPLIVLVTYALLMILWSWRPFALRTDVSELVSELSLSRLVPLLAHRQQLDLASVADIGIPFFLLVPVGALLAVWPLRRRGWVGSLLPGLYLAAVLEVGQIAISGRFFDGTDLIIQCAAVAMGWAVIRGAGYRPYGQLLPVGQ